MLPKKSFVLHHKLEPDTHMPYRLSYCFVVMMSFLFIVMFLSTYMYSVFNKGHHVRNYPSLAYENHKDIFNLEQHNHEKKLVQNDHTKPLIIDKKLVCYYNVPTESASDLQPSQLDPNLCTHINIAFAYVANKSIQYDKTFAKTITAVRLLKLNNTNIKVLASIGGAGNNIGFSDMVTDHASRKVFIKSIKSFLTKYKLDGIDLDWEFPGLSTQNRSRKREKQHFVQLLRELREEFQREKKDYLLTVAVAAPEVIVDKAYHVNYMNDYVDFVNIMTYDFHFYTKYTPFTGLNSPLYARTLEEHYLATLNINFTMHMYLDLGMDRDKIVIGIPTYGHSYTLVNRDNGDINSPASGYGNVGHLGFASLPQICSFLQNEGSNVVEMFDVEAKVPYLHYNYEWISYENEKSVSEKAKFIKNNKLGGAMIYSLNCDDFSGLCTLGKSKESFPLTRYVSKYL